MGRRELSWRPRRYRWTAAAEGDRRSFSVTGKSADAEYPPDHHAPFVASPSSGTDHRYDGRLPGRVGGCVAISRESRGERKGARIRGACASCERRHRVAGSTFRVYALRFVSQPRGGVPWHATKKTFPAFEPTSKRRRGFPSETRVKRGDRVVHGNKELVEKLGRNDPCPCGSTRRFQAVLPEDGALSTAS